jgi:LmbE family N-acetylglucosaminyl deacetylase
LAYPNKTGKGRVEKWFQDNEPSEEVLAVMLEKIAVMKQTDQWLRDGGKFIPYPATWLNQKRWEDEVPQQKRDVFAEFEAKHAAQ